MKTNLLIPAVFCVAVCLGAFAATAQVEATPPETPPVIKAETMPDGPQTPKDLKLIAVGIVEDIPSMESIKINKTKITPTGEFMLAGIRVPIQLKEDAISFLRKKLVGEEVGIFVPENQDNIYVDKFGKVSAHIMTSKGIWIQAELVGNGLAYAFSTREHTELVRKLYDFEKTARRQKLGLWDIPELNLKNTETIGSAGGSFQVYEGIPSLTKKNRDGFFFIFSTNATPDDLTAAMSFAEGPEMLKDFRPITFDEFEGRRMRIRGWVENKTNPFIAITHAEQIELIDTQTKKQMKAKAKK